MINANEYNLRIIDESNWKWAITIVLRLRDSERHNRKILNKEILKFTHKKGCELFPKSKTSYNNSFLGVCTVEAQKQSKLQHHHLIIGNLWREDLWFNNSKSKLLMTQDLEFNLKVDVEQEILRKRFECQIKESKFFSESLNKACEIASADVQIYIPESIANSSWRHYVFKSDNDPYWSPSFQKVVKRINQVNESKGLIPDDLIYSRIWTQDRRDLDTIARCEKQIK